MAHIINDELALGPTFGATKGGQITFALKDAVNFTGQGPNTYIMDIGPSESFRIWRQDANRVRHYLLDHPITATDRIALTTDVNAGRLMKCIKRDFGARGNGTTDDTAAFHNALSTGSSIFVPAGNYRISSPLYFTRSGQMLVGEGESSQQTCFRPYGSFNLFNVHGNLQGVSIEKISVAGHNQTGGCIFNFDGSNAAANTVQIGNLKVRDVFVDTAWNGAYCRRFNGILFDHVKFANMRGDICIHAVGDTLHNRGDLLKINHVHYSPHSSAIAARTGHGLVWDGYVHTVQINTFVGVGTWVGMLVRDSFNLPNGAYPMGLFASDIEFDFPHYGGLVVSALGTAHLTNTYIHGTKHGVNALFTGSDPNKIFDVRFANAKITGAHGSNILFNGRDLELHSVNATGLNGHPNAADDAVIYKGINAGLECHNGLVRVFGGIYGGAAHYGATQPYGFYRMPGSNFVEFGAAYNGTVANII